MDDRPNVVFLIADDHRYQAMGNAGDRQVRTPTLDALAARGASFHRAYTMGGMVPAVCVPSRAALLTGTNPFRASTHPVVGDYAGSLTINPALATLPAALRAAGYHTYAIGKWHNDPVSFNRGFADGSRLFFGGMADQWHLPTHEYDPTGAYPPDKREVRERFSSDLFADAALRFLATYAGGAPYFLYVSFTAPHDPRTAPPEYAALYDPERLALSPNVMPEHPFDNGELRVRDELLAPFPRPSAVVRRHLADYYAMVTSLDAAIGRILAAVDSRGDGAGTLVVYTSDHGLAVGQHGLLGKQNLYEHSLRVPRLMAGPGVPAGVRVDALSHHGDVFPTLCALIGLPAPDTIEGADLTALWRGGAPPHRRLFAVYKGVQRMVTDGRWKLIRYSRSADGQAGVDRLQLFDLTDDPWELRDRADAADQRERIARMSAELAAWQRQVGDPLAPPDGA